MDFDVEFEKLKNEYLNQSRGSSSVGVIINPLADLKKKEFSKVEAGKFRLITKKNKQIIIKEVSKINEIKNDENNENQDDDSSNSSS